MPLAAGHSNWLGKAEAGCRVFATLEDGMQHCEERFLQMARHWGIIKLPAASMTLRVCTALWHIASACSAGEGACSPRTAATLRLTHNRPSWTGCLRVQEALQLQLNMEQDGLTVSLEELASAISSCAREVSFQSHQSIYEASLIVIGSAPSWPCSSCRAHALHAITSLKA